MLKAIEGPQRSERQATLISDAAELAMDEQENSEFIGYVTMAFYSDGTLRTAGWRPNPEDHRIGSQMFEAWARAGLEHHIAYAEGVNACYSVLNGDA